MAKFFNTPFGASASKTTIPVNDGVSVSWNNGYTVNYEYNPVTDKSAKHIERDVMNTLFYEITSTLRQLQINGVAPYYEEIIRADGPGYGAGALVSYGGQVWRSKVDGNKVIPNASSKDNWEILYGYDNLVIKLKEDGVVGESGGSTGGGYTREEIDAMINGINTRFINIIGEYYHKELGEIFLMGHCGEERQEEGFFICNGDYLPFDPSRQNNTGDYFYGNQLYALCYEDGAETAFKSRWKIAVDSGKGRINLPNILGHINDDMTTSDYKDIFLTVGKDGEPTNFNNAIISKYATAEDTAIAYRFKLVPTIYLGTASE